MASDHIRLSSEARHLILRAKSVAVSSVSMWEIAVKFGMGKLNVDAPSVLRAAREDGFLPLPFTDQHALAAAVLPEFHNDPFDRALVAQSVTEPLILLTADEQVAQYGATVRLV